MVSAKSADNIMVSSCNLRRSIGDSALPAMVASVESPTAKPNHNVPAFWSRNQKARWKNMNPTRPRISHIVREARSNRGE